MVQMDTIGDAYVAAVLLPPGSTENAEAVACCRVLSAARGMINAVAACRQTTGRSGLACRIGVSVGCVMAGVLGQLQPRFHIFGSGVRAAELHEQVTGLVLRKNQQNSSLKCSEDKIFSSGQR
jgi:class 3 adenylate cyclase